MTGLLRSALVSLALLVLTILLLLHGTRGVLVLMAIVVATTLPRTRLFQAAERALVRLTGSRRRAAALAAITVIAALAVINIVQLMHS